MKSVALVGDSGRAEVLAAPAKRPTFFGIGFLTLFPGRVRPHGLAAADGES